MWSRRPRLLKNSRGRLFHIYPLPTPCMGLGEGVWGSQAGSLCHQPLAPSPNFTSQGNHDPGRG